MNPETILRLLGYTLDAGWTFGPALMAGVITWRLAAR